MSEAATPGQKLDAAIGEVREAFNDLRTELNARADAAGQQVVEKVDALSDAIDELQASWHARSQ
jgi:hypothetical protein